MSTLMSTPPATARPRLPRRIAPALGLLVLAPWVGEYLLGNIPIQVLVAIPFLIPLYGGGALLIREVTRRTGRGWPTIFLLGAAYGIIQAGLVDQSLFNPSFGEHEFLEVTPVPGAGISAYNAMAFVVGHAVWSISVPIAIVETLTPARRTTPWLGRAGLTVTGALYLLGCWIIFSDHVDSEDFMASRGQLIGAAVVAAILIGIAFAIPRPRLAAGDRAAPKVWRLGVVAFVYASVFIARPENWWGVLLGIAMIGVASAYVLHWSRRRAWSAEHRFALAAAALLTYAWTGFVLTDLLDPHNTVRWIGNAVFALLAVALVVVTARRLADPIARR
jgi:hypothetical protein